MPVPVSKSSRSSMRLPVFPCHHIAAAPTRAVTAKKAAMPINSGDTTNNNQLDWWSKTQIDLSNEDAERTDFDEPLYVVPYGPDTRTGSTTYGQMLFELWPHPITQLPYTFGCQANWPALTNPSDTLPFPLTEELVKLRAYEMLYLWKESQKGDPSWLTIFPFPAALPPLPKVTKMLHWASIGPNLTCRGRQFS